MIKFEEIRKHIHLLKTAKKDALTQFVLQGELSQLDIDRIREENLQFLFAIARKYKVRYLYVGKGEICGCENKKGPDGWCAMWTIAKEAGFPGSCGNGDQYQCKESEIVFPEDSYGGWDLKTGTKLTEEESDRFKFNRVVTRQREKYFA